MDIQPGFILGVQAGWLCPDGHYVGEVQTVVVLWFPDPPDICLDSQKLILTGQQPAQKGALCSYINCVPKLALGKCPKPGKSLFWRELLTVRVIE